MASGFGAARQARRADVGRLIARRIAHRRALPVTHAGLRAGKGRCAQRRSAHRHGGESCEFSARCAAGNGWNVAASSRLAWVDWEGGMAREVDAARKVDAAARARPRLACPLTLPVAVAALHFERSYGRGANGGAGRRPRPGHPRAVDRRQLPDVVRRPGRHPLGAGARVASRTPSTTSARRSAIPPAALRRGRSMTVVSKLRSPSTWRRRSAGTG